MINIKKDEEPNIVYSSDPNFKKSKKVKEQEPIVPKEMTLNIRPEKKGRGGKTVCVIYNFPAGHDYFKKLTKKLKRICGSGGTFKGDSIEVQGDHRETLKEFLEELDFNVKFTGG